MLGGMCGEVYRAVSNVVVVNERGEEWPPFMTPLADWLEKTESKRFYLRWQQNPALRDPHMAQALSAFLVTNIISAETLDYLATDIDTSSPRCWPASQAACARGIRIRLRN